MRLIITADWHLRATLPRCRVDNDWYETQKRAVEQVKNIAVAKKSSVAIIGDIFHSNSDTSFRTIQIVQDFAKELAKEKLKCYILAGNHDLIYHSTSNINKSAIGILFNSENIYPISSLGDDVSAPNFDEAVENKKFVFRHILCFPNVKSLPPNVDAVTASELLAETPKAKYVFTGDYHHNFHYEKNGRSVINPGCLLRQASDMKDYQCGVYFVDTEERIVSFVPIIDNELFVDDSYILKQNERTERIESFVDKLQNSELVSLDFVENVKSFMVQNKLEKELVLVVEELLGVKNEVYSE